MLFPTRQRVLSQRRSSGANSSWSLAGLGSGLSGHQFPVPSFVFKGARALLVFAAWQGSTFISLCCLHIATMRLVYRPRCCKNLQQEIIREQLERGKEWSFSSPPTVEVSRWRSSIHYGIRMLYRTERDGRGTLPHSRLSPVP